MEIYDARKAKPDFRHLRTWLMAVDILKFFFIFSKDNKNYYNSMLEMMPMLIDFRQHRKTLSWQNKKMSKGFFMSSSCNEVETQLPTVGLSQCDSDWLCKVSKSLKHFEIDWTALSYVFSVLCWSRTAKAFVMSTNADL